MKTEEEVRALIDHLEESLHDHHLFLNEQHVIDAVLHSTDFMIRILKWVVEDDVQSSTGPQCAGNYYDKDAKRGTCTHPLAELDTECDEHQYCEYRVDPRGSTGSAK